MTGEAGAPTPFGDVNRALAVLLAGAREVLGAQFTGLYVYGSLAMGDFTPGRSDVDFVVVTAGELPELAIEELAVMHARLTASGQPWVDKLEGPYIPQGALRRYDPAHNAHPALRVDGSFAVDGHGSDWVIQRHVIRENGIVVAGPPPRTVIDPVAPDELRQAARGILREWWQPMLTDAGRLQSSEYQAYAILTMCRSLYTLHHADAVSKIVAATWAKATQSTHWHDLIDRALAWRHGMALDALDEVRAFIRYTLARSDTFA